jgi:hypothetical protein
MHIHLSRCVRTHLASGCVCLFNHISQKAAVKHDEQLFSTRLDYSGAASLFPSSKWALYFMPAEQSHWAEEERTDPREGVAVASSAFALLNKLSTRRNMQESQKRVESHAQRLIRFANAEIKLSPCCWSINTHILLHGTELCFFLTFNSLSLVLSGAETFFYTSGAFFIVSFFSQMEARGYYFSLWQSCEPRLSGQSAAQ